MLVNNAPTKEVFYVTDTQHMISSKESSGRQDTK